MTAVELAITMAELEVFLTGLETNPKNPEITKKKIETGLMESAFF
jgi:hypothetical protein